MGEIYFVKHNWNNLNYYDKNETDEQYLYENNIDFNLEDMNVNNVFLKVYNDVKYFDGKFQLFGIYCSANCTLSGIVHGNQLPENLWERVSLLNLLYFKVYGIYDNLIPAPDKMALKMFGGSLDIADYRRITNSNEKSYTLEFPPCNTIIPVLEEIYKKNTLTSTFIPVDSNRIKKANNELKLKRSKPLNNNKSNLYASMGIK